MVFDPFTIQVAEETLLDLRQRLERVRWPDQLPGTGWDYGTDLAYLRDLVTYWHDRYDWQAQQNLLNAFPQFLTEIDGIRLHFQHIKGQGTHTLPLIITHGWPGSFFEMYKIIGPLTDPARYGGDPADAFDVVVPSLPGYGFSGPTRRRGIGPKQTTAAFASLMHALGYERFGAQGSDWGSLISSQLGSLYPDRVVGIHVDFLTPRVSYQIDEQNEETQRWRERLETFRRDGAAYAHIHDTRPQTLAYSLNDSPVGLASWMIDMFRSWSDCHGDVESVFTRDELLTNIMIYWVTQTINSSIRFYYETSRQGEPFAGRIEVPTGVAVFPQDPAMPPQEVARQRYNIQRWTQMKAGGHYPALEQPQALVEDIRAFFRPLRNACKDS